MTTSRDPGRAAEAAGQDAPEPVLAAPQNLLEIGRLRSARPAAGRRSRGRRRRPPPHGLPPPPPRGPAPQGPPPSLFQIIENPFFRGCDRASYNFMARRAAGKTRIADRDAIEGMADGRCQGVVKVLSVAPAGLNAGNSRRPRPARGARRAGSREQQWRSPKRQILDALRAVRDPDKGARHRHARHGDRARRARRQCRFRDRGRAGARRPPRTAAQGRRAGGRGIAGRPLGDRGADRGDRRQGRRRAGPRQGSADAERSRRRAAGRCRTPAEARWRRACARSSPSPRARAGSANRPSPPTSRSA